MPIDEVDFLGGSEEIPLFGVDFVGHIPRDGEPAM